jgi:hypothetical protein
MGQVNETQKRWGKIKLSLKVIATFQLDNAQNWFSKKFVACGNEFQG